MPTDIMRLWSLPLPHPLFSSSLSRSTPLLSLGDSVLLAFPPSIAGGVKGPCTSLMIYYVFLILSKSMHTLKE